MRTLEEPLQPSTAYRLGRIAYYAGSYKGGSVDFPEYGKLLLQMLREEGFLVIQLEEGERTICAP